MNIRFLETAIWLAQLRNFRATADRLNITSAAISNRIAAMEQELGFKLFERDTRDVSLTAEGATFVEGARDIVARYNELVRSLDPTSVIKGSVRIGLPPSMALALLPYIASTLRRQFPNVRFSVLTLGAGMLRKLETGEIDIALVISPSEAGKLRVVELCTLGMFWVASPSLVQHGEDEVLTPEDIAAYPIISYEAGAYNDLRLLDYISGHGPDEPIVHRSNSLTTTVGMAIAGIGVAVLPPVTIQRELREGSLRVLKVSPTFPSTSYAAVYPEAATSRLPALVASIACDAAAAFCSLYDDSLAYRG
ncbi:MAG: LysR family transcriptional regulator [Rhizobiales bacterium]|nr:LysR family transcriptional regulator [Hyphomicrobiales bacterium]